MSLNQFCMRVLLLLLIFILSAAGCGPGSPEVILYAAQDRVYAEPILREFEEATGIRVRAVYDSEAVKTVGLANRLLAEESRPQCDVFWGNEELRTRQLAARGIFAATNGWAAFGQRSRRMAVASRAPAAPNSIRDLTNAVYRQRVALAYPLFGSTATHLLALRQHWGESNWLAWCRALAANQPFIVDGNSVSVKFLERGEVAVALTDSDDIFAARREGAAIEARPVDTETLLIPNTVAVIRGGPHPAEARRLFDYLRSEAVITKLIAAGALEAPGEFRTATQFLRPDWDALLRDLERGTEQMKEIFRR
jgi:iron(III) transport system substrate-binding protein